jgi:hypothetical protein
MKWNGMEWNGMEWSEWTEWSEWSEYLGIFCVQRRVFSRKELKDIFSVYYEKVRASTFSPL